MCGAETWDPVRRTVLAAGAAGVVSVLLAACGDQAAPAVERRSVDSSASASNSARASSSSAPAPSGGTTGATAAARAKAGVDDVRSLAVVVDKRRPLQPRDWVPQDLVAPVIAHTNAPQLRRPAARALEAMAGAAKADGVALVSLSAYRSYAVQRHVYDTNLTRIGRAATEKLTLRPGYSEHQTGLAVDLGGASRAQDLNVDFADTAAFRWLQGHAWQHGWVLRYEEAWTRTTGIQFEPWHYRYLGAAAAAAYHRSGLHTLEQFSGLPAAPGYA